MPSYDQTKQRGLVTICSIGLAVSLAALGCGDVSGPSRDLGHDAAFDRWIERASDGYFESDMVRLPAKLYHQNNGVCACSWIADGHRIPDIQQRLLDLWARGDPSSPLDAVAYALGKLGDKASEGPLTAALQKSDHSLRRYVVYALGDLQERFGIDERTMTEVCRLAQEDESVNVRAAAIGVLELRGDSEARRVVLDLLKDSDPFVACQAERAMAAMNYTDKLLSPGERPPTPTAQ